MNLAVVGQEKTHVDEFSKELEQTVKSKISPNSRFSQTHKDVLRSRSKELK